MLRRWLLALPALLMVAIILAPVTAQEKDAPKKDKDKDAKKDDTKKDDKKDDTKKDDKKKDDKKGDAGEADLSWGFKENKPFYQKMTTTTDQTMTVSSNQVVQKQKQVFGFSWTPVKFDKDKNEWVLKQKIEAVIMDIDIGNQKIAYDSTKKDQAANPLSDFFKALVGTEFTITLDMKKMEVTKLEGRKEFVDKLVAANPQMKPLLEQILSEKAMKEMAEPTFAALPGVKKKKGDSWAKKSTLDMGPIGTYENTYKYTYDGKDDKEKKLDRIKVETTLVYKAPGDNAAAGSTLPFKIKSADLKTTEAKGHILYDPELKRIEKTQMDLELKGKLVIDIGGQPTEVDLTQKQTSTVETSDKNPFGQ
jgi:hypothetical protein